MIQVMKVAAEATDMRIAHCWCWRTGAIDIAVLTGRSKPPRGVLVIAKAPARRLDEVVCGNARLAFDNETLLVPGVPEAATDDAALAAVVEFQKRVLRALDQLSPEQVMQ